MNASFGYLDRNTCVHRLDPRTKLLLMIVVGMVGFVVPHFGWIAINLALLLPFVLAAKCARQWLFVVFLASIPAWFIAAINMFWGNSVIPSGHVPGRLALDPIYAILTGDAEPFVLWRAQFGNQNERIARIAVARLGLVGNFIIVPKQGIGFRVMAVTPNSAAARAGLIAGDTILTINKQAVRSWASFLRAIGKKKSFSGSTLKGLRGNGSLEISVK